MEPTAARQRQRVDAEMAAALETKSFTYTELLCADEPVRTMGLEYLDGLISNSGRPESTGQVIHFEPVRLVQIDGKPIKFVGTVHTRVPGTGRTNAETVRKELPADSFVPDLFPDRLARRLLVTQGWPVLQSREGSGLVGQVVEYRWLQKAAAAPDATEEVKALWERLGDKPSAKATPNRIEKGGAHASP